MPLGGGFNAARRGSTQAAPLCHRLVGDDLGLREGAWGRPQQNPCSRLAAVHGPQAIAWNDSPPVSPSGTCLLRRPETIVRSIPHYFSDLRDYDTRLFY